MPKTNSIKTRRKLYDSPEYRAWSAMTSRCRDPNVSNYHLYGGRGIVVCSRWINSFKNFLADMGYRPDGKHPSGKSMYSIDRRDNSGPYSPENCYWATSREQANNFRDNVHLRFDGVTLNITQWAKKTGIPHITIRARVRAGWPVKRTLTEKPQHLAVTYNGETKTVIQWADGDALFRRRMYRRIRKGWCAHDVLFGRN